MISFIMKMPGGTKNIMNITEHRVNRSDFFESSIYGWAACWVGWGWGWLWGGDSWQFWRAHTSRTLRFVQAPPQPLWFFPWCFSPTEKSRTSRNRPMFSKKNANFNFPSYLTRDHTQICTGIHRRSKKQHGQCVGTRMQLRIDLRNSSLNCIARVAENSISRSS